MAVCHQLRAACCLTLHIGASAPDQPASDDEKGGPSEPSASQQWQKRPTHQQTRTLPTSRTKPYQMEGATPLLGSEMDSEAASSW